VAVDECLAAIIFAGENDVTLFRDTLAKMHSMVMELECHVVDFISSDLAILNSWIVRYRKAEGRCV